MMHLNPALTQEIHSVMEEYWNSYFEGNLEKWASFIPDTYRNIGTTQEEIWSSKKEIVDYTLRVFEQMVGMADFRNKRVEIIPYDPYFMVHELGDLYVKTAEDWVFYAPFRLSSLIEKPQGTWKILHQHGSFPDLKAAEGEAFGLDVIKAENERLKKAVEERTLELERQKRELEIEAALERVRARTLAMNRSDELADASKVLEEEVRKLGIQTWGCAFHIYDEENPDDKAWDLEWFTSPAGMLPFYKTPRENIFLRYYEESKKGKPLYIEDFGPERIKDHYAYLQTIPIMGDALKELAKSGVPLPKRQIDHSAYFNHGHLLFITYEPVPEAHDIFIRFAKVFNQTYSRFLDLKKSEAHALQAEKDLKTIKEAKRSAEKALSELKSTQAQLIQAEKMASLGELTAGIAHEIQNPLNFVNNFSEVSGELIEEAQVEIEKGDLEEIKFILQDLKDNLSKINHHGKRAGSIVRGMLEHSRKSEGKRELVDLNALADECLKLGFHGLRAKDKTFSADFKVCLAQDLPEISIVRQDIGRVLLNLINNAFYSVHDFGKTQGPDFKPLVMIQTKFVGNQVEISVCDNGKGISKQIVDKIFQPFFTTKPTGEGTGLGLSLSYDIVKAHGGELTVKSTPGEGASFLISIPFQENSHGAN